MTDVIEVPQECASLVGWYAISERAMREMTAEDIRKEAACVKRFETEKARADIAEVRAEQLKRLNDTSDWWSRYGLIVGLGGGTVFGAIVGTVVGLIAGGTR